MDVISSLKIRTKLTLFIVVFALVLMATGAAGLAGITVSRNALASVYGDHLLGINILNEIRNRQMQIRIQLLESRQQTDAFEIVDDMDRVRGYIFQIEKLMQEFVGRNQSAEERRLYEEFVQARLEFGRNGVMPMMDLLQKQDIRGVDRIRVQTLNPAYEKASRAIDAVIQYGVDAAKADYERVTRLTYSIYALSVAIILIGVGLAVVIGLVIVRPLTSGVRRLEQAALRLADGDLTARADLRNRDELGEVANAFNRMAGEFGTVIGDLHDSADKVAGAAGTLTTTSDRVAEISRGQMEGAATAAHSIEDLNAAVKEIAQRAEAVVSAVDEANAMSDHGRQVVGGAVQGIREVAVTVSQTAGLITALGQRSNQIGQIVQVIKGIAEQTNLLALNAAIEAARAGEQGRGFAVVADEVRNLAERTGGATAEIADMIRAIQTETGNAVSAMEHGSRQVESGVEQANEAMQALQKIDTSVKQVVEMIQGIAAATRSQSQATETITSRVEEIAAMARNNNSNVDHAAQAAHDLHKLSAHFQQRVSKFRV